MYNPPANSKYLHIHPHTVQSYRNAYEIGYNDAKGGREYKEPYEPSNHERDTSHSDELNYQYYCGYYDYEKAINSVEK
jgi:hypothetical protein